MRFCRQCNLRLARWNVGVYCERCDDRRGEALVEQQLFLSREAEEAGQDDSDRMLGWYRDELAGVV